MANRKQFHAIGRFGGTGGLVCRRVWPTPRGRQSGPSPIMGMDCTLLGKYHVSVIGVEALMIRNYLLQRRTGGGMTRFQQAMAMASVGAAIVSSAAGLLQADTILKNGTVITVEHPLRERGDLWVTAKDLERINGLTLKPPGVLCLGDVCINLSQKGDNALLRKRDGQDWVNVTGLAQESGSRLLPIRRRRPGASGRSRKHARRF